MREMGSSVVQPKGSPISGEDGIALKLVKLYDSDEVDHVSGLARYWDDPA